jgi:hypothetical protein
MGRGAMTLVGLARNGMRLNVDKDSVLVLLVAQRQRHK